MMPVRRGRSTTPSGSALVRLAGLMMVYLSIAAVFFACASNPDRAHQVIDERFGDSEILNYEYTNRGISEEVRDIHYLVNTEIDDPAVVKVSFPDIGGVHAAAPAGGSAIVQFVTDAEGKVVSYRFVKRAGLGLDEYVEKMVKSVAVEPLVLRGEKCGSVFNVRFVFSVSAGDEGQ